MKKIGCFKKEGQEFIGTVILLHTNIRTKITPVQSKPSPQSPDYSITKLGVNDFAAELGGGWAKTSPQFQVSYLEIIFDSPALQHPIHTLLCEGKDGLWYLFWDRIESGEELFETLFVQEELKPQLGIRPITNLTLHIQRNYPDLAAG